ncbi:PBSX family phage terminase large subunit [Campylobacter concisus]|uniref:PBSX family phage terminase large subunit n=1 Tax=Campylobacter concisus TaxID=199 RepID=UPI0018A93D32|nr:PBSX family phage terminase large subunit [Campylobacter concisus]QPI00125.1 PBSX family phage terminase large subunit [Campylobacter concisus]QPI01915.1 PBSX family phage terminase large subunit [Campylobacter concisus]
MIIDLNTAPIFEPLLESKRYKGAKGGRGSGKSHFFAECIIETMLINPNARIVCIREIQRSLKFSSKALIESKINSLGVSEYFEITLTEIRAKRGNGLIIFQGMQDHTADSIKSLEGFDIAWVEEAQNLSKRSLELLRPTIRKESSELWFSWNPENETDAVDSFFKQMQENGATDFVLITANFSDNPFLPTELFNEQEYDRRYNPSTYEHIWLGGYNTKSDALIFKGKFRVENFSTDGLGNPYHGLDFGFANDPTAAIRCYIHDRKLYISHEAGAVGLELDYTAEFLKERIENIHKYVIRADNARPESISYLKRHGLSMITPTIKGKGSIEDGIEFIRSFETIIIHERCVETAREFRLYSYKTDPHSGDILPQILDENNHYIDALRYALEPLIKSKTTIWGHITSRS